MAETTQDSEQPDYETFEDERLRMPSGDFVRVRHSKAITSTDENDFVQIIREFEYEDELNKDSWVTANYDGETLDFMISKLQEIRDNMGN